MKCAFTGAFDLIDCRVLTRRRNAGDEARRSGGLRINFDHLGIFNVRRNLVHTGVFAFRLHQKSGRRGRESNPRPRAQQRNALATEPPRRVAYGKGKHHLQGG